MQRCRGASTATSPSQARSRASATLRAAETIPRHEGQAT
eukprot:CAMPEP_0204462330 /NCGR_PEP_ID=MMETSP0471-20130131/6089_1 /ASSEMBLY_ACC=CAM_ASM_000602 /TAXON_ID=2969 /ORGANISM="Oxyrrhis marina" /LENGTH=38 /DNA_ID= /DNA_START= /DNA_END= /DNA_ORIENTATION=